MTEDVMIEKDETPLDEQVVVVNGVGYPIIKTGRAQARQVLALTRWFSKYGGKVFSGIEDTSGLNTDGGFAFLQRFVEGLDEDAIIDAFQLVIGCPKEDAELYFDISQLVETSIAVYNGQPAISRLVQRFFSNTN